MLEERLGIPVFLGNDANAAALGEFAYGAGRGYRHVIYITVSTGVGGGIISDGRLLEGQRGAAGEVGHVIVEPGGPLCGCGNRGCLEALISGTAIARQAREALVAGRESAIGGLAEADPHGVAAEVVVRAARGGDGLAGELLETAGRRLGTALLGLVHIFDPQVIVVGGGVTNAGELLMKPARDTMFAGLMPIFKEGLEVVPPDLGADAGLYGAVALARRTVGVRVEDT
jgi:glucokinase